MNIRTMKLKYDTIHNHSKEMKYLEVNLFTFYIKWNFSYSYAENYAMLMKEIKDGVNKQRDMLCIWIKDLT